MQRSESRILTTHAGALPRPDDLLDSAAKTRPVSRHRFFRLKAEATCFCQLSVEGEEIVRPRERSCVRRQDP